MATVGTLTVTATNLTDLSAPDTDLDEVTQELVEEIADEAHITEDEATIALTQYLRTVNIGPIIRDYQSRGKTSA